jgi:branched-chain amino acid transport system substrate-binding protein
MQRRILNIVAAAAIALMPGIVARAEDTIKVALIDPLSGPFAAGGQQNAEQLKYALDSINGHGGALRSFEILTYDDKFQPSEALNALKSATDQGIPLVLSNVGSNIAAALIDGVEKHNARSPDSRVLYASGGATATELTNEKCSFWFFRFIANTEQFALMLVRALPPETKKVYLLNQDYLYGQSLQRDSTSFLAKLRPDVEIVGNELIPLGKVKDFSPYVSKVRASGAQALITGNFGPDLNLLIKAGTDSGLDIKYYTVFGHLTGAPTAIGPAGDGRVLTLQSFNENLADEQGDPALKEWVLRFRASHDYEFWAAADFRILFEFLQAAIEKAGSTDPLKVALALEGMTRRDTLGHEVTIRAEDHQLLRPYYVSVFSKDVKYDSEHTGLGWKVVKAYEGKDLALPTTCKMKRPIS